MQTESKGTMEERLDRVERGLLEVKDGLGSLTDRVGSLEGKVGSLEGKVGSLEGRVGSLESKVDILDRKVDVLDQKVDRVAVLTEKNTTEIQKLAEGLRGLDEKMDRGFQDLKDELKKDRAMFTAAIRNHEGRIGALERTTETGEGSR